MYIYIYIYTHMYIYIHVRCFGASRASPAGRGAVAAMLAAVYSTMIAL